LSDDDDPFGDALEPVAPKKRKAARGTTAAEAIGPEDPGEGAELDRQLAGQLMNDFGNAQRLIARFGVDLLYVENNGWFAWDGARWNRDLGRDEAIKRAHQTALAIWQEVDALEKNPGRGDPEEKMKRLRRHAVLTGNTGAVNAMLTAASPYLSRPLEALDSEPYLLAAPNGTIELGRHCEFREARRADSLTRRIAVPFSTKSGCPHFEKFLERIMPAQEMRDFLQRVLGYCLTGSTRDQALFLFYGTGQNGKSTLVNVLRHIMGDYAMVSPISTFLAKREGGSGGEASPDLARLPGARLVTAAEPPEGARLDEGKIKEITGGEPIVARHLNQGFFTFKPVFKAIISTNHQPTIRGVDHGIWRRIRLLPFLVQIPDAEVDRDLEGKLIAEAEGILQWLLTGVEEWFAGGLAPPAAAIAAVENYRADQDPVGEFLKDRCVMTGERIDPAHDRKYETTAKELFEAYKSWCEAQALDTLSGKLFGSKLTARGIGTRKTDGRKVRIGVVLKASAVADNRYEGLNP
jgi:putative DNA primase/helicase